MKRSYYAWETMRAARHWQCAPYARKAGCLKSLLRLLQRISRKTGDYIFALVGTQPDEQAYNAKYIFQKYLGAQKVGIIYVNKRLGESNPDKS